MREMTPGLSFVQTMLNQRPSALAWVTGTHANPSLSGRIQFYDTAYGGILIEAELFGLPNHNRTNASQYYAFHIHETGDCSDQFSHTGDHYAALPTAHPMHSGDLPPLLGNQGYAWTAFYDKRFRLAEIIGRSIVIHSQPDDFNTQPSGNAGAKIGCGVILTA